MEWKVAKELQFCQTIEALATTALVSIKDELDGKGLPVPFDDALKQQLLDTIRNE